MAWKEKMKASQYRSESHGWLATSYHEAGHALAVLLLGHELFHVEIISHKSGVTCKNDSSIRLSHLIKKANTQSRISPELISIWLDEFWIADAGAIAEAEFNLIPDEELIRGSLHDVLGKFTLIPDDDVSLFAKDYFYRNIGRWHHLIQEDCRRFFRKPNIYAMTRILAEALLRTRSMDGETVVDTLLSNIASSTRQTDLFWDPMNDNIFGYRQAMPPPMQLCLF